MNLLGFHAIWIFVCKIFYYSYYFFDLYLVVLFWSIRRLLVDWALFAIIGTEVIGIEGMFITEFLSFNFLSVAVLVVLGCSLLLLFVPFIDTRFKGGIAGAPVTFLIAFTWLLVLFFVEVLRLSEEFVCSLLLLLPGRTGGSSSWKLKVHEGQWQGQHYYTL